MSFATLLLLILTCLAAPPGVSRVGAVEFPAPLAATMLAPGASVQAVRMPGQSTDDLVVGQTEGMLALYRLVPSSGSFLLLQQLLVGGRTVCISEWLGLPVASAGVVVATADPDRLHFIRLAEQSPWLRLEASVDLDEDPGSLAWFGEAASGTLRPAVSLPGIDAVALLDNADSWHVARTVALGDQPFSITGADLDGDGRREIVAAQRGVLSGDLAVITVDPQGLTTTRAVAVAGLLPGLVAAVDLEGDGRDEVVVTQRDRPGLTFLRGDGLQFTAVDSLALALPARFLTSWWLTDGAPALLTGDPARGACEFSSRTGGVWTRHAAYYPGCRPLAAAVAELTGDGQPDLAVVGEGSTLLTVLAARPGPGFAGLPSLAIGFTPGDLSAADFDGDGRTDVLVAAALAPALTLFVGGDGGGQGGAARALAPGFLPGRVVSLNLDADAALELAVFDVLAGDLVILDADAAGAYVETERKAVGSFPTHLATGDIDADGLPDLLAVPADGSRVQLLFGTPAGGIADPVTLTYEIATQRAMPVDLNGDGLLDIVGVEGGTRLWWRLNLGGRTFGAGQWLHAGNGAALLAAGDLDGDGDDDVVVGCRIDQSLISFENGGAGALSRRTGSHALESEPTGLRLADLDGDGRDDIVVGLRDRGAYAIYLSFIPWNHEFATTVAATPDVQEFVVADVNDDGAIDLMAVDGSLRLGVAHLNLDPGGVALEPRALEVDCADEALRVRIEPAPGVRWRLEALVDAVWLPLAAPNDVRYGRLESEGGVWYLTMAAGSLADGDVLSAVRLVVDLADGSVEMLSVTVAGNCLRAAGAATAGPRWLATPWPNPGNPLFRASFRLPREGRTRVTIHDPSGRRVAVLLDAWLPAGAHDVEWDGSDGVRAVAAGVYLLRIDSPGGRLSGKLTLLK